MTNARVKLGGRIGFTALALALLGAGGCDEAKPLGRGETAGAPNGVGDTNAPGTLGAGQLTLMLGCPLQRISFE
jgi:hypothetical protein